VGSRDSFVVVYAFKVGQLFRTCVRAPSCNGQRATSKE
jgi:hypothetical protein